MIDLDRLSSILSEKNIICAEVITYNLNDDGKMIKNTTFIDYHKNEDYHWSTSSKPLFKE